MSDLNNRFEHILYEFEMCLFACRSCAAIDRNEHNLAADSFAIHLRSLAVFFCENDNRNRPRENWHVSDVLDDISSIDLLSSDLCKRICKYTSKATGHLGNDRLNNSFKKDCEQCYKQAFPQIAGAIGEFLSIAPGTVKPAFKAQWEATYIQQRIPRIESLLHDFVIINYGIDTPLDVTTSTGVTGTSS